MMHTNYLLELLFSTKIYIFINYKKNIDFIFKK